MKSIIIVLSLLSCLFSPFQNTEKVYQYLPVNTQITSLSTNLDGNVKIVFWAKEKILVETSISADPLDSKALQYAINKGQFQLITSTNEDKRVMTIESKRINTMILIKGQEQKTKLQFRIFIPERLKLYSR